MKKLLLIPILFISISSFSQQDVVWSSFKSETSKLTLDKNTTRVSFPKTFKLFELNLEKMQQLAFSKIYKNSNQPVIISLPNVDGQLEQFEIFEASNFDQELQAKFPEIRAFSGKGITDKYATLKLSISPQGVQTMVFRTDKPNEFIEPYTKDHTIYAVFISSREKGNLDWNCSTEDKNLVNDINKQLPAVNTNRLSDGKLRTIRLAQSCNAEYSNYFGATSAAQVGLVLAAFNATLTRCNGVYEKDLALHLNLVASSTNLIYYVPSTDPYTTLANWNTQLQKAINTTLTGVGSSLAVNNAAYDIGHMFGASGGGGNAGCIGCICVDGVTAGTGETKGRGITSPGDGIPQGDNFDVDYVVHEIGHQLGGNHTFSFTNEGYGVSMEIGSGVTIMGYAGITPYDVAPHSIDKYHASTIAQIEANLQTKSCPVTTNIATSNATPTVNAGLDYIIPISTPYVLTAVGSDANANDALTYSWEQYDDGATSSASASSASETKTIGPNFISWDATASPKRYFPRIESILLNSVTTSQVGGDAGMLSEALSSVNRDLNFRVTVRDNAPYTSTAPLKVGQTNFDDMLVSVNSIAGPFIVTSQNTSGISYLGNSSQTITWNVANTTAAPINTTNVKITFSSDNFLNSSIVLLATTPNNGSAVVTIPNGITSTNCRIKVEALGNVYFNVNTAKFAVSPGLTNSAFGLQNFELYPNPSNGNFNVKFDSDSKNEIKIAIHDLRGREVFSKLYQNNGFFNENIQLSGIQSGVYLFNIQDGDKKEVKKIIIE